MADLKKALDEGNASAFIDQVIDKNPDDEYGLIDQADQDNTTFVEDYEQDANRYKDAMNLEENNDEETTQCSVPMSIMATNRVPHYAHEEQSVAASDSVSQVAKSGARNSRLQLKNLQE